MKRPLLLIAVLAGLAFAPVLEPGYAVAVVDTEPGVGATSDPELALGAPLGGGPTQGSTDTYTLGSGGSLTLRLDPPAVDGGGADLLVCENAFFVSGTLQSFVEAAFVEVSSDGVHYARFPSRYTGPDEPLPGFTGIHPAHYKGFAGAMWVQADSPSFDPLDLTAAGGDCFDLAELAGHELVLQDKLDLWHVAYVRIVDAEAGTALDDQGAVVYDCGIGGLSACDIDAVVALNTFENQVGGRPRVETDVVNGFLVIVLEDGNGLSDLKAGLRVSVNGLSVPFGALLPFFQFTFLSPTRVELTSLGPIPPGMFLAVLRIGTQDTLGLRGGDGVTIQ